MSRSNHLTGFHMVKGTSWSTGHPFWFYWLEMLLQARSMLSKKSSVWEAKNEATQRRRTYQIQLRTAQAFGCKNQSRNYKRHSLKLQIFTFVVSCPLKESEQLGLLVKNCEHPVGAKKTGTNIDLRKGNSNENRIWTSESNFRIQQKSPRLLFSHHQHLRSFALQQFCCHLDNFFFLQQKPNQNKTSYKLYMEQEMVLASCKLWKMDANELTCPTQTPQPKFFGHWIAMGTCLKWQALFWRWSFLAKLSHGNPTWTHRLVLMFAAALPPTNATCPESVAAFFICAWSCSKSILPGQGKQKSHAKLMKSEHIHRSKTHRFMRYKYPAGAEVPNCKDQRWQKTCFYTMCQKICPGVGKADLSSATLPIHFQHISLRSSSSLFLHLCLPIFPFRYLLQRGPPMGCKACDVMWGEPNAMGFWNGCDALWCICAYFPSSLLSFYMSHFGISL